MKSVENTFKINAKLLTFINKSQLKQHSINNQTLRTFTLHITTLAGAPSRLWYRTAERREVDTNAHAQFSEQIMKYDSYVTASLFNCKPFFKLLLIIIVHKVKSLM